MNRTYRPVALGALIAAVTFLTFMPALGNDFTNWDDQEMVTGNPHVVDLTPAGLVRIFTRPHSGPYVPLTILSFAAEYRLFRLNPFFFHLTNILLHVLNVLLVFALMRLLLGNLWLAAAVALLFGLHPLRVESVAWVTERKDVLSGFFFLTALIVFVRFRSVNRRALWLLIPGLFVLAVLAKPMAFTLPAVLLLLDYLLDGKVQRSTVRLALILLALALPLAVANVVVMRPMDHPPFALGRNILIGSHNILFYLGKVLAPVDRSIFYPYPNNLFAAMPLAYYLSPFILLLLILGLVWSARYARQPAFGILFFIIMLLPVSQFIPLPGAAMAADRYTYLPSIGIVFVLGSAGRWRWKLAAGKIRPLRIVLAALAVAVAAALAHQSYRQCYVWKDSVTLWTSLLRRYPDNSLGLNNRGRAYSSRGQYAQAIQDYDRAIRVDPQYELPYYNRAVAYDKLGEFDRALADYGRALDIKPDLATAYESRGATYSRMGRYEPAIADFNRALKLDGSLDVAYLDRGFAYFKLGLYDQALADYNRALELDPNYPETYLNRGDVFFVRGQYRRALADYTRAIRIQPSYYAAYYNRAAANKMTGDYDRALADYDQALRLKPDFAEALNNRGNLYVNAGAYELAIADYDRALAIRPDYGEALYNRAGALYLTGRYRRARDDLMRAEQSGFPADSAFIALKTKLSRLVPGP